MVKINSTQRLATISRLCHVGEWTVDTLSGEIWWSDETYNLLQVPKTEQPVDFTKENKYFAAAEHKQLTTLIDICTRTGDEHLNEFVIHLPQDRKRTLSISLLPIKNIQGDVTGIYAIWMDVTPPCTPAKLGKENINAHDATAHPLFYKDILDNISEDIVLWDNEHRYIYINKQTIRDDSVREWLIGKDDFDYCRYRNKPVELAINRRKQFNHILSTKTSTTFEEEFEVKNATRVYKRVIKPVYDEEGKLRFVVGYGLDVTDLKNAEKNNAQFSTLVNSATEGIAVLDYNGHYQYVNKAYAVTLGYKNQEDLIADADRYNNETRIALVKKVVAELKKNKMWEGEYCSLKKDGTCVQLEVRFTMLSDKEIVCVFRDIDAKVKQREELKTLALVASRTNCMVTISDKNKVLEWANDSYYKITGYTPAELIGKKVTEILCGSGTDMSTMNELSQNVGAGKQASRELLKYTKQGKPFWAYVDVTPVLDKEGKPHRFISVQNDISHIKNAEEKLKQLLDKERKLGELKSEFVTIASHEFRTPLAIIQSSADIIRLLQDKYTEDAMARKLSHLGHIKKQVHRLTALLDDILMLGKVEEGKLKYNPELDYMHIQVRETINAHKPMFESITDDMTYTITGTPIKTMFDKKCMEQIIANLLSNAIKYSPGAEAPVLSTHYGENDIEIRVKDYGIGIPDEDKPNIFQKFTRAKNVGDIHGYGLGLALVKSLVEMHAGTITFDSIQDKGTTFIVTIPYKNKNEYNFSH